MWKDEVERRGTSNGAPRSADGFDNGEEAEPRPAAIEAKAAVPGTDMQTLLDGGAPSPEAVTVPVPDIKLDDTATANYSTNV